VHRLSNQISSLTFLKEINPVYYDLENFQKGELKTALQKTLDKMNRRAALKGKK
jgi:pre-mRNA-splicing factor ATP-dependent RNA helicase DHX15/PRP43